MDDILDPRSVERDLAHQLVRAFAGVDAMLQQQYENDVWRAPDAVAERLVETVAARLADMAVVFGPEDLADAAGLVAEAVDNLGSGEVLDPWAGLAFRAPVGV